MEELEIPPQDMNAAEEAAPEPEPRQPVATGRSCRLLEEALPARALEDARAPGRGGSHRVRRRRAAAGCPDRRLAGPARGARGGRARPAHRGIRPARTRRSHPPGCRRLQNGHQAGASRNRARLCEEPEAPRQALAAGARNPRRDRLQAARHRPRGDGDSRRPGRRRAEDPARPQAHCRRRPQERHRQADSLPDHQGIPDSVRAEGPERAAHPQGVRRDPPHGLRRQRTPAARRSGAGRSVSTRARAAAEAHRSAAKRQAEAYTGDARRSATGRSVSTGSARRSGAAEASAPATPAEAPRSACTAASEPVAPEASAAPPGVSEPEA